MKAEQLLLILPADLKSGVPAELTVHQWAAAVDQFAVLGGRELILGGPEPLAFPGFWLLARRGFKAKIPRITAHISGSWLEPWVHREVVDSGLHLLISLEGLRCDVHEALHGPGSHARAMAAIEGFLEKGLAARMGLLSIATCLNYTELPDLVHWADERQLTRLWWSSVPDGGWPASQLKALKLPADEKLSLALAMKEAARRSCGRLAVAPVDPADNPGPDTGYASLLRIYASGEAHLGLAGDRRLGNVRTQRLEDLLDRFGQAAGD